MTDDSNNPWVQAFRELKAARAARDAGMKTSEENPRNGAAVDAARQALEVRIKTCPVFTSSDVIKDVTDQGIEAKDWRCIGGMIAKARRQGRIEVLGISNSRRPTRHCGDQKMWRSMEYVEM